MPTLDPAEINNDHEERIRYWNKIYRTALLSLVIIGVAMIGFTAFKINENTQQTKDIIISNNKATIEARKANKAKQNAIIQHIDCVLLLNKKYPGINFQALTYQQAYDYLNKCAEQ